MTVLTKHKPQTSSSGTSGMRIGRLLPRSAPGALIVELDGGPPLHARTTLALDQAAINEALQLGQGVVLMFENNDPELPIAIGLVQVDEGTQLLRSMLRKEHSEPAARTPVEARVDGKRVVIEGKDEIVLKCGDASIVLKRDGKVLLRGAYVETHSRGVNRIKGGSVKIN
jgi:Domain of unknown function (DUF6484)